MNDLNTNIPVQPKSLKLMPSKSKQLQLVKIVYFLDMYKGLYMCTKTRVVVSQISASDIDIGRLHKSLATWYGVNRLQRYCKISYKVTYVEVSKPFFVSKYENQMYHKNLIYNVLTPDLYQSVTIELWIQYRNEYNLNDDTPNIIPFCIGDC